MELEALVKEIVREVAARMGEVTAPKATRRIWLLGEEGAPRTQEVCKALGGDAVVHYLDDASGQDAQRIILPRLSCSLMADLSLGRASSELGRKILNLLLAGKTVEVFSFEYREFETTAPSALTALYENYEKTLAGFGVTAMAAPKGTAVALTGKLVTEKDVAKAAEQGVETLSIPATALVTPLAKETAKTLNIQLMKR